MRENRRRLTSDQPGQTDLTSGRGEQILSAHDERDALHGIVDRSAHNWQVELPRRSRSSTSRLAPTVLFLTTNERIVEHLDPGSQLQPPADVTILEKRTS